MRRTKKLNALCVLSFVLCLHNVGCSDDPTSSNNGSSTGATNTGATNTSTTTGTNDTSAGSSSTGTVTQGTQTGTTSPTICVPLSQCLVSQCGIVDDGCGGTLDCGQCRCEGGQPVSETCGQCGLGQSSCTAQGSTNDGFACAYPIDPLRSISEAGDCSKVVYVSQALGATGASGSSDDPFATYAEAAAVAQPGGVILLDVAGRYEEELVIKDGVHIFGGYRPSAGEWQFAPGLQASINPPQVIDGDTFGIRAEDVSMPVVVGALSVTAPDAPETKSSYGVYVSNTPALSLTDLNIRAGRGGEATAAMAGADGADGPRRRAHVQVRARQHRHYRTRGR